MWNAFEKLCMKKKLPYKKLSEREKGEIRGRSKEIIK